MPKASTFPDPILEALRSAKILGVRAGADHRYTAVWVVVVGRRVFVRSWNNRPAGWFEAFSKERDGTIQVGDLEIPVRARVIRSAPMQEAVTMALGEKYNTKGSRKWVEGFAEPARAATTIEFVPGSDPKKGATAMKGSVQHLNPDGLHHNPAFSQAVVAGGNVTTIYVGGQNAVDASGNIVGKGDIGAQSEQALKNLQIALAAGGAKLEHVVKWNIYIVQGQPLQPGFEAFRKIWGDRPNPPAITGVFVAGLTNPDFLVEIDAIAVVPQES